MKAALSLKVFENEKLEDAIKAAGGIGYAAVEIRTCPTQLPISTTAGRAREIKKMVQGAGMQLSVVSSFTGDYSRLEESGSQTCSEDQDMSAQNSSGFYLRNTLSCQRAFDDFKVFVDLACELGAPIIRHWPGWQSSSSATPDQWQKSIKWMRKAAEHADTVDKLVGIELHHGTLVDGVESSLRYIRDVDMPGAVLIHDA